MIRLSKKTQELIKQYNRFCCRSHQTMLSFATEMPRHTLVQWLTETSFAEHNADIELLSMSLDVALLSDLLCSMGAIPSKPLKQASPQTNWLKFYLIIGSGTLLAACEGFDGISTLLSVFTLPSLVTLVAGFAFSLVSVMVFYGLNLVHVSKNLGVKLNDTPKLIDLYLLELDLIKNIRKKISSLSLTRCAPEELADCAAIIKMLQERVNTIIRAQKQFAAALDNPKIISTKRLITAMAGALFFGSGFFAGQSVGTFIAGLIVGSTVGPAFLPVTLFAMIVGIASLSLYWFIEKENLDEAVSSWFGLEKEKLEQVLEKDELSNQAHKLACLKDKIIDAAELVSLINQPQEPNDAPSFVLTSNPYSFYKTKRLLPTLPNEDVYECTSHRF